jgi:hypothetical protein
MWVCLSCAVVIAIAMTVSPFVYSDEALQLKALQQYLGGESPSLNQVVTADPSNLTRDVTEWITWWPPGTQLLTWPLVRAGAPIGTAVQVVACTALLLGCLGWARWWRRFELPRSLMVAAAILLPWLRYSSNAAFQYSAEILGFAATPWTLLIALHLVEGPERYARSGLAGVFAGILYWLKYSSVFITASVMAFLCLELWPRRRGVLAAAIAGCALPIVVLSAINRWNGGAANMFTAWHALRLSPDTLVYAIGNPGLMAADADSLLQYLLTNQVHGLWRNRLAVAALGIPAGLTLGWLIFGAERKAERLAAITLFVTMAMMVVAWIGSSAVSFESRHIAGAAIASLPAAIAIARRRWAGFGPASRAWIAFCGIAYVCVPWALYGPMSVATKAVRQHGYITTGTGLYNPILAASNAQAAMAAARGHCLLPDAVWYIPEPLTSMEFAGRMVITAADFEALEYISALRFHGEVPVCALMPPKFETNGKGAAIRNSFVDIGSWSHRVVPGAVYDLWIGMPL